MNSKKSDIFSKKATQPDNSVQPAENVLIISVLKRLESIADMSESYKNPYRNSLDKNSMGFPTKRENVKITPMQLYERSKSLKKKSNRYKF